MRPHSLTVYLRARDSVEQSGAPLRQPLLNPTNEEHYFDDDTSSSNSDKPLKVIIRIKSDSSTEVSTDDDESMVSHEDPFGCIGNHRFLSPSKPSARALIYSLYLADLAVGSYLIVSAFMQRQYSDEYGYTMIRLTSGLLLFGGSIVGMCLHTPVGKLFSGSDAGRNRSLMVFNTSFAFIAVGIYYTVSVYRIFIMSLAKEGRHVLLRHINRLSNVFIFFIYRLDCRY